MVLSPRERPGLTSFRGLEQFHLRGDANGVGYCIAGAKPYALEFSNSSDVICLLLGDINSNTKFEDDREKPLVFLGDSTAFHPRVGNVRETAKQKGGQDRGSKNRKTPAVAACADPSEL